MKSVQIERRKSVLQSITYWKRVAEGLHIQNWDMAKGEKHAISNHGERKSVASN